MRLPVQTTPARIAPLATLPVFFKLHGRRALLAGSSDGALWKAELLAAAGVDLTICATENGERLAALAQELAAHDGFGRVTIAHRNWTSADFAGLALAIGDFETEAEAVAFHAAARAAGVPVNLIDKPEFCDFQFGSIVNRSPLVVAISTDGAAPVFGQAIRARIETALPKGLAAWAAAAREWRPAVQARNLGYAARRRFWEVFTALALRGPERAPCDADRDACLASLDAAPTGGIALVGAGPGDAGLLTLNAMRALQAADVILYDDLVTADVLELARREAERIAVGKTGHGPSCAQADITALMVQLALQGKRVVRLKGGDPMIFGRATEEIEAARAAGIAVEIVPGISAAQAAAATLGLSLTERKVARRLQFVTGHDMSGSLPADLDWSAMADPNVSTAVYMPRKSLDDLARKLVRHGLPASTPAVAIASISRPEQQHVAAPIANLPERATAVGDGPLMVLIGQAFAQANHAQANGQNDLGMPRICSATKDRIRLVEIGAT